MEKLLSSGPTRRLSGLYTPTPAETHLAHLTVTCAMEGMEVIVGRCQNRSTLATCRHLRVGEITCENKQPKSLA